MNNNHQLVQFNQITDLIYLGTNLCCTAIPHIEVLVDLGIKADIDLEEERQEQTPNIENIKLRRPEIHPREVQIEALNIFKQRR